MGSVTVFILIAFVIASWFGGRVYTRRARRQRLWQKPFPAEWQEILRSGLPVYSHLSDELRTQLHQRINVFLGEKRFEGCDGLEITDEIRVTVAAQACVLLLNRETRFFPKCRTIYVYPDVYVSTEAVRQGGVVTEVPVARSGESWTGGPVVLAWDHVKKGAKCRQDGHNVVFHEFAHQLDQEDGQAEGYPRLDRRSHYLIWARYLGGAYKQLREDIAADKPGALRDYAATNPAEYFAVATEAFFECPHRLKAKLPKVYQVLKRYYKVNPVEWFP